MRERILAYTRFFSRVDIIVMCGGSYKKETIGSVMLIPTNSSSRVRRIFDAIRIGRALEKADIVTVQDPFETGYAGLKIAERLGAKLHVQVHTDFLAPAFARLSLVNRVRVWIAGYVLRRASRVRVVSEHIKRSIETRFNLASPVVVLPIYADVDRFAHIEHNPDLIRRFGKFATKLLVVARLEPEKNVALAIRAFAQSAPSDTGLIIIGKGGQRAALESAARDLGVADRVFFEETRDPGPHYRLSDLVLVPSKYEGYGLVIVEALAAGKPVLSTDVGIAREVGAIVTTEAGFADALAQWFKDGSRTGVLKEYPYKNFDEYLRSYVDDIQACV